MSSKKIPCRYGLSCYRRNPTHFEEYDHPPELQAKIDFSNLMNCVNEKFVNNNKPAEVKYKSEMESDSDNETSSKKRIKLITGESSSLNERLTEETIAKRFGFFLSKVDGIDSKYNKFYNEHSVGSVGIKDILDETSGKLIESAQFSYMFELDWLMDKYPLSWRKCPLYVVYGVKEYNDQSNIKEQSKPFPQVIPCPVKITDRYGTHHTKMMLFHFEEGLRIVIHTANMVSGDWSQKTQGVWISPIFPPLDFLKQETCETNFKVDLLQYLKIYKSYHLEKWCNIIQKHDFSSAKVFLVASVPGRHKDLERTSFGHLKLRQILSGKFGPNERISNWPAICQFSSIGSLGPNANNWLTSQFLSSLAKSSGGEISLIKPQLKCIFPSVENVRNSLEGYNAGASLPYSLEVSTKQQYLTEYFHQWKAISSGRNEASPHIKTYCRQSPDCTEISWFLLTSANLSKAAWGELQLNGSQLAIRSFELGVLFLPKLLCKTDSFKIKPTKDGNNYFPLPYDTPLSPYSTNDKHWIWNERYEKLDRNGRYWSPP